MAVTDARSAWWNASAAAAGGVATGQGHAPGHVVLTGVCEALATTSDRRRPNTDDLALEKAGVATDFKGCITVDDGLLTDRRRLAPG